jgi:lactose/L-arabinose transport system substrate-binding protein
MKKKVLALLLASAMVLGMAGCGASGNNKNSDSNSGKKEAGDELTVWCWDPSFNILAMDEAEKIYQKDNPDVSLNVVEVSWEDIQTKLTTAANSGQTDTLPDIILMNDTALLNNVKNYPDLFADLTDSGIEFSDFAEYKTAIGTVDGKNYNVPFDSGVTSLFLRTDIIKEAGYSVDDFTDITWSKFIELGESVLAKTGKPLLSAQAGGPDMVIAMLRSAGDSMFDKDGKPNLAGNDVVTEAVEDYKTMIDKGILVEVNDWDQYIGTINNGTVASVINGCWISSTIMSQEDQSGLWSVTTMPRLDQAPEATNYSNNGGAGWMVMENSPNKELAIDFLKSTFGSSSELFDTILPETGAISTYLPAAESAAYSEPNEFFGGEAIYETLAGYGQNVPAITLGQYWEEAKSALGTALTQIQQGQDIQGALKEADSTVEFAME